MTTPTATVAAGDIARLAGVGRAAVSNWRRRFPDFPAPVGGSSASPLFALVDVEAWLTRHGKPFVLTATDRVWQSLRGAAADRELGDRIGNLGGFLIFLDRQPEQWKVLADQPDAVVMKQLVEAVSAGAPEYAHLITHPADLDAVTIARLAAEAADQEGSLKVFDFLCQRYLEVHSRRYVVTPPATASLMVAMAAPRGAILDPACGIGSLLIAADATILRGQETNPTAARIAAARLLLAGRDASVEIADSLRADAYPADRFDAVLCAPPFGERSWGHDDLTADPRWEFGLPPRGEPELAWVQHCLHHVKPGGRVAILMPSVAASRRSGRRIRANLIRAGVLRAVVSLPTANSATAAADLWLLRRPDGTATPEDVLLADARTDIAVAEAAWSAHLAGSPLPEGSRVIPVADLLDEDVDLTPARHLPTDGPASASAYPSLRASFGDAVADLVSALPDLEASRPTGSVATTTIGELVRCGAVLIRQAPMGMATDEDGPLPVLTARDVRLGRPPSGTGSAMPGAVPLQPDDVVTPLAPRTPAVQVVTDAGPLLGPRLYLLRADPHRLDPYFLAGVLRTVQRGATSGGSSLMGRVDIRRTRVPQLPLAEQRRIGAAFRRLLAFETRLREMVALGEELVERGFLGLAGATLRPTPEARREKWESRGWSGWGR